MKPLQFKTRRTIISIGLLAIAGLTSFLFADRLCLGMHLEERLPGDAKALLDIFSAFGHGAGCLIAVLLVGKLDNRGRSGIGLIVSSTLLAGVIAVVLKVVFRRPRPFYDSLANSLNEVGFVEALSNNGMQSFPSGHTATAFALAVALSALYPKGSRLFFGFSFLTAFQRVLSQSHFPSDVCAGAIVGIISAHAVGWLFERSRSKLANSSQPRLAITNVKPMFSQRSTRTVPPLGT